MRLRLLSAIALLLLVATSSAEAQNRRHGLWFSGGLGYGSLSCDDCEERVGGGAGFLTLGGTVNPHWLLGVGTAGFNRDDDGVKTTVGTLDFRVRFYPSVTSGFFLTGGIGYGSIKVDIDDGPENTENGASFLLGLGYDIPIGKTVSLTPFLNGFGVKNDDADANVGQIGLAITVH
jgi:hypothetical protein